MIRIPFNKLLFRYGIRTGSIIHEYGTGLRSHIAIDDNIVLMSVDVNIACGINGAIERIIAKVAKVVAKKIFGFNVDLYKLKTAG